LLLEHTYKEFSKTGFRRIDLKGKINFRENLDLIRQEAENSMMKFDFIYDAKLPNFVYMSIEKEKINLRVWMKFTNADGAYLNAQSQCLIELSKVFKDLDVEIARDEILYLDRK
jgi:phage terminase large subunit-like protein